MGIPRLEDLLYHPRGQNQHRTGLMVTFFFVLSCLDEFWEKKITTFFKKFHMNSADCSNYMCDNDLESIFHNLVMHLLLFSVKAVSFAMIKEALFH